MATMYKVINVAHGRHNRGARAGLPANPRLKQHVGTSQQRVLPGRPVHLSEEQLQECLPELRQKVASHIFEVRTHDDRLVDLSTLKAAPPKMPPPLVKKRLDSVNYDKPSGIMIPPMLGDDGNQPGILPKGAKPDLLKDEEPTPENIVPVIPGPVDPELEKNIAAAMNEESAEPAAPVVEESAEVPAETPAEATTTEESSRRSKKNRR
jgi:hypothetical protein